MKPISEKTEVIKKNSKIEGVEYLQQGDLLELSKALGVHRETVYCVARGKETYKAERIRIALAALIEIRKKQLVESVNNVAGINEN
jgi:hypothetical protein